MSGPSDRVGAFLASLLQPGTVQRYDRALGELHQYCSAHGFEFKDFDVEAQDYVLCDCVLELVEEGRLTVQECRNMVAGTQKLYCGRRKFSAAFRVIEGLAKNQPPQQAAPFPQQLLLALVVVLAAMGREAESTALLISFCGLLRISEALNLQVRDVLLPATHGGGQFVVLLLGVTKRGPENSEKVIIDNSEVVRWIELYMHRHRDRGNSERFLGCSYNVVRYWLRKGLQALRLDPDSFRTHSCRRGGATAMAMARRPLSEVMLAGRWSSEQSCRLYIKKAEVALARWRHGIEQRHWSLFLSLARIGTKVFDCVADKPNGNWEDGDS